MLCPYRSGFPTVLRGLSTLMGFWGVVSTDLGGGASCVTSAFGIKYGTGSCEGLLLCFSRWRSPLGGWCVVSVIGKVVGSTGGTTAAGGNNSSSSGSLACAGMFLAVTGCLLTAPFMFGRLVGSTVWGALPEGSVQGL